MTLRGGQFGKGKPFSHLRSDYGEKQVSIIHNSPCIASYYIYDVPVSDFDSTVSIPRDRNGERYVENNESGETCCKHQDSRYCTMVVRSAKQYHPSLPKEPRRDKIPRRVAA